MGRYKEIFLLFKLSEKIINCPEIQEVASLVLEEARQLLKSSHGTLLLTQDTKTTSNSDPNQSNGVVVLIRDMTAEKEVARMKTDFLSTVSHELRTPFTSVLGFAKLIQKKLEDTILPAVTTETKKTERAVRQVRDNLGIIVAEGERLTALIKDVLDISKIEAGKIDWNMQPTDITAVINQAISATSVLVQTIGLDMICEFEPGLPEVL